MKRAASTTRRELLGAAAVAPVVPAAIKASDKRPEMLVRRRHGPVAIASANGLRAVETAVAAMDSRSDG